MVMADILAGSGVAVDLLGMHTIEPLDGAVVRESARRSGAVVTVEEHYVRGGLSAAVADELLDVPVRRLAIGHVHVETGLYEELIAGYSLDPQSISDRVREVLGG